MKPIKLYKDLSVPLYIGETDIKRGVSPTPPAPITYLTQWQMLGNSEVHTLPYPDGVVLPNGYKRCEYLQSDGAAYIEVPFGFDKTDEIYAKVAIFDITHADKYFVAPKIWNDNSNRLGLGVHNIQIEGSYKNVFVMVYGNQGSGGGYLSPVILSDTEVWEWEYKNYICSMGGSIKDNSNIIFGSETANLRLFYGYNTPTECKIYEYRHKKANAEYRLIPCLDSNDTPCMYDVINNQAYYNSAGSGSFTYKLYPQPTEIWSCGEYSAVDGKYHILVQPQGGSIADIALDEPLRKVNDVADTIEFPSDTEGKALVTRSLIQKKINQMEFTPLAKIGESYRFRSGKTETKSYSTNIAAKILFDNFVSYSILDANTMGTPYVSATFQYQIYLYCPLEINTLNLFNESYGNYDIIYELGTPTTELVDAPQIAEADSYTCEISQGGKAVSWSSFEIE